MAEHVDDRPVLFVGSLAGLETIELDIDMHAAHGYHGTTSLDFLNTSDTRLSLDADKSSDLQRGRVESGRGRDGLRGDHVRRLSRCLSPILVLLLTLCLTELSLAYLLHLAVDDVVSRLCLGRDILAVFLKALACFLSLFFLCLSLTDSADSVFYLFVALLEHRGRLFLSLLDDILALLTETAEVRLVAGNEVIEVFLLLVDGLPLVFPVPLVAYDILQIFVALDIV